MDKIRILFSVLDWGIGHASRCVPIIEELIALDVEVIIAGSGDSHKLLQAEFPQLEFILLANYPINYPRNSHMYLHMLRHFPAMRKHLRKEQNALTDILEEREISAIISDNRYGLHNAHVPCVFITHQLQPPVGLLSPWMHKYLMKQIEQFDHCWIADFEGEHAIAGQMSNPKGLKINASYLGSLSRFKGQEEEKKYDVLAILSGPEPQRSMLENQVIDQLSTIKGNHCIVRGSSDAPTIQALKENIDVFDLLDGKTLEKCLHASTFLVSRSGYSSIMDYLSIGKKALLVPTPGQPEQEYLADRLQSTGHFVIQKQSQFDLNKGLEALQRITNPAPLGENKALKTILQDFCEALY